MQTRRKTRGSGEDPSHVSDNKTLSMQRRLISSSLLGSKILESKIGGADKNEIMSDI